MHRSLVVRFLKTIPTTWDETRLIDGYPGRYVVLARRHGNQWYVAGLNAQKEPLTLTLDLGAYGVGTLLNDDDTVAFGNHTLQVIHTPGHSPGGVCLYCAEEKAVFTGDVYFNSGMIAENAVAQSFTMSGRPLFFYSRRNPESHRNELEIDFLIRRDGAICPVEAKSGKYQSHASLDKFCAKFKGRLGQPYILYTKDVMEKDGIVHLPLYMAMFL